MIFPDWTAQRFYFTFKAENHFPEQGLKYDGRAYYDLKIYKQKIGPEFKSSPE